MRIGVDFDDVLYPYHHYLKQRIKQRWGVDLTQDRVTTFYYEHLPALQAKGVTRTAIWNEVSAAWKETDSHAHAALLDPHAPKILRKLQKDHHVTLVSARTRDTLSLLRLFLDRHDIRPHDIRLGAYEKTGFDLLIDDFPKHVVENADSGGYGVLYTSDENSTFDESRHPRIHRVDAWKDIPPLVERLDSKRRQHA